MSIAALRDEFNRHQRIEVVFPDAERHVIEDDDGTIIRHIDQRGDFAYILYSHITGTDDAQTAALERLIAREKAFFAGVGRRVEWKTYNFDTPPSLVARLTAHGFSAQDEEALLVLDLAADPPPFTAWVTADVRRVTREADIMAGVSVLNGVWSADSPGQLNNTEIGTWLAAGQRTHPDATSIYLAYADDGTPAAFAWMSFHAGGAFAGMWGGSTLPAYRGRGLYTALVAARAQEARQRGVRFLTIDASPMSKPICLKHGFIEIGLTTPCVYDPRTDGG